MGGYSSDSWRMERFPGTVALQALSVHTERAVATGTGGVLPFGTAGLRRLGLLAKLGVESACLLQTRVCD